MAGGSDVSLGTGILLLSISIFILMLFLCGDCITTWVAVVRHRRVELVTMLMQRIPPRQRHDAEQGLPEHRPPPVGGGPSAPEAEAERPGDKPDASK